MTASSKITVTRRFSLTVQAGVFCVKNSTLVRTSASDEF